MINDSTTSCDTPDDVIYWPCLSSGNLWRAEAMFVHELNNLTVVGASDVEIINELYHLAPFATRRLRCVLGATLPRLACNKMCCDA